MGTAAAVLVVLLFVLSVLLWLDDFANAYIHVQLSVLYGTTNSFRRSRVVIILYVLVFSMFRTCFIFMS